MIKEIPELNFPSYATLSKATVTLNHMGEKNITTQISIYGGIRPEFSYDWEVAFKGEKYIMPLREPQALKANDSISSKIDLTFQHWPQYQLKRWYFFTLASVNAGVAQADKYIASVSLNLNDFVNLFRQLLQHYYGDSITIDLNPKWEYSEEPVFVNINHSYMWDVLIQLYELYAVRWEIVAAEGNDPSKGIDRYVIRVGYDTTELDHIFEYGFEGGLLKVERQVQDDNIRNMLIGRGGEKNLPLNYFKKYDSNNSSFKGDPDWVHELANVYFDRLRSAEFRSYVQGWKYKHQSEYASDIAEGRSRIVSLSETKVPWAWNKGYTDTKFDPVEFVADEIADHPDIGDVFNVQILPNYIAPIYKKSSIAKYGPLLGGLDNNEDIYPSIQGVERPNLGRIDKAVDVEQVTNDAPTDPDSLSNANLLDTIIYEKSQGANFEEIAPKEKKLFTIDIGELTVEEGQYANLESYVLDYAVSYSNMVGNINWEDFVDFRKDLHLYGSSLAYAVDERGDEIPAQAIPQGTYTLRIKAEIESHNETNSIILAKLICEGACVKIYSESESSLTSDRLFDVWIKNIWETTKGHDESEENYVKRVWEPIIGSHLGDEAAICFASGNLSTSEDYEFKILGPNVNVGIHFDQSKRIDGVNSEWRITCIRSDADYDSLGMLVPNTTRQGSRGDLFYFIGIELTQWYIDWAEERLYNYKRDQLLKVSNIVPTWVVSLDKVRIGTKHYDDTVSILDQLHIGSTLRLADKRFIADTGNDKNGKAYEILYLNAITYKFNESSNSANFTPDVEVTLGTEYVTSANPVATIQGSIDSINRQLGSVSTSNIQQIMRMVGDKIYLRKDGITDRSLSKTYFADLLASLGFRQGMVGGQGWGFFRDENGKWVLETDRVNVRDSLEVNNLVINQITARGGMIIESAASMEVTFVEDLNITTFRCYFDTKGGSVRNLFVVDDIAYCHRFTPENNTLKYYKFRISAVGEDYIDLNKMYYNGSGSKVLPAEGDVIVQYGNYSNNHKDRQFVIIRDVIGGGYERMLCNLNSVDATGDEYYFAGYQSSNSVLGQSGGERFFIGSYKNDQYIEYKNGKLYIPGQVIFGSSYEGGSMIDFIQGLIDKNNDSLKDYIDRVTDGFQDQIDGVIETWFYNGVPTLYNYPASEWDTEEKRNNHAGDLYYDNNTGTAYRFSKDENGNWYWNVITDDAITKALEAAKAAQETANGKRRIFTSQPKSPYDVGDLWVNATFNAGNREYSNDILRCVHGQSGTGLFYIDDWSLASKYTDDTVANKALEQISDYEYLKEALGPNGRTEIYRGLVLSQLIQLGVWSGSNLTSGPKLTVWSGINGIISSTAQGGGIAVWYGGDMLDGEEHGWYQPSNDPNYYRYAKALVRFDGSGYFSNGAISWKEDGSGHLADGNIYWDKNGTLHLNTGISIDGSGDNAKTLETILNTLNSFTAYFRPVLANGTVTDWSQINNANRPYAIKSEVGFYSDSFISAMGMNSASGSGSGSGTIRVSAPRELKRSVSELPNLDGKAVISSSSQTYVGNLRVFQYSNIYVLKLETMQLVTESAFTNADPNTLRTYTCRNTNGVWGQWQLMKEESIPG